MTTPIRKLGRALTAAAFLTATALSVPLTTSPTLAGGKTVTCPPPPGVPRDPFDTYRPGDKAYYRNKTYICDDNGTWIIITDDPVTPPPPSGGPVPPVGAPLGGGALGGR